MDYAYAESFYRDYTPYQTDIAKNTVKEYVSGLFSTLYFMMDGDVLNGLFTYTNQNELFDFVEPFINSICLEFARSTTT